MQKKDFNHTLCTILGQCALSNHNVHLVTGKGLIHKFIQKVESFDGTNCNKVSLKGDVYAYGRTTYAIT